jgi:Domain of unknown function (DUF1937)
MTLIYLASPYSHPDESVRYTRFYQVCEKAGSLIKQGYHVFCPIAHSHNIAVQADLPRGFDYWGEFDRRMIAACDELWVYRLDGWDKSVGVLAEIEIAHQLGKPVVYMNVKS